MVDDWVDGRVDHFSDFSTRTPGIPVVDLVAVIGLFKHHVLIHIYYCHHFSSLVAGIGTSPVKNPSAVKTHFSGIKGFNYMFEIGHPQCLLDGCFDFITYFQIAAGDNLTVGPILLGAARPVNILTPTATVRRIVNMTALTVVDAS